MAIRPSSITSASLVCGTQTGSPMTMASVENGRLMVKALQLGMAMKRLVAMANGTTGRPDSEASVAMPSPARRAGPGGTSAVMATVAPLASARSDFAQSRRAAAIALPLAGARAPDQAHAEAFQHRADRRGVAVARDHGPHVGRTLRLQLRQQHELPVPHGEDLRMLGEQLGFDIFRLALDAARGVDQPDIGGAKRADNGYGGLRC